MKKDKEKMYQMILTESQMGLIAQCVEDCHRFMAGQTELSNTLARMEYGDAKRKLKEKLSELKPFVTPELTWNESYDWAGNGCENDEQRLFIAQSYCIYREILHKLCVNRGTDSYSVYNSPTLTCRDGGALPMITLLEDRED